MEEVPRWLEGPCALVTPKVVKVGRLNYQNHLPPQLPRLAESRDCWVPVPVQLLSRRLVSWAE